jgi:hypothetical protein
MKRRVPKDKSSGIPKKYLSGVKGGKRTQLASVLKRISTLYRSGKRIPESLLNQRLKLGRKKKR